MVLKFVSLDLAADGFGEFVSEYHDSGIFVGSSVLFDVVLNFFFEFFGGFGTFGKNDGGFNDLTADFIGSTGNAAFQNIGQFHDNTFDLEGPDAVTGGFDHVIGAADIPEEACFIHPSNVAGVVETVMIYGFGAFFISVIAVKEAAGNFFGSADADFAVFPGGYFVAFAVKQYNVVEGAGFPHGTDADISAAEVCDAQCGFGLTETFHDFQTGSLFELTEYFGVQSFAGSGHMLNGTEVIFTEVFFDQHSEHGRGSTECGDLILRKHGQDVGGIEAVEIVGKYGAFGKPLAVEFAPEGFAPAGVGNGEMDAVSLYIVPVFGGDVMT